jgi:hypothetical protein
MDRKELTSSARREDKEDLARQEVVLRLQAPFLKSTIASAHAPFAA